MGGIEATAVFEQEDGKSETTAVSLRARALLTLRRIMEGESDLGPPKMPKHSYCLVDLGKVIEGEVRIVVYLVTWRTELDRELPEVAYVYRPTVWRRNPNILLGKRSKI